MSFAGLGLIWGVLWGDMWEKIDEGRK